MSQIFTKGTTGGSGGGPEFLDTQFRIKDDADNTKKLAFSVGSITTSTTRTITFDDADLLIANIPTTFSSDSGTATPSSRTIKIVGGTGISTSASSDTVTITATSGGPEFLDTQFRIKDDSDNTKKLAFSVGNITTSTTRTITFDDADLSVANIPTSFSSDSGTATPASRTIKILGTSNEIETSGSSDTITIGIPNNPNFSGTISLGGYQFAKYVSSGTSLVLGNEAGYNLTGQDCTFVGYKAGRSITSGPANICIGYEAGLNAGNGQHNLILGHQAGGSVGGNRNVIIGTWAGSNLTSSSASNIYIANSGKSGGESNVIRIGNDGSSEGHQNKCYIAGIYSNNSSSSKLVAVASDHQLATQSLSGGAGVNVTTGTGTITLDTNLNINSQTGTSYTLVLSDAGKFLSMDNSSDITVTVPPNSSVAFETGTQIIIYQKNTGTVTISAGSGVTINAPNSANKTKDQYSMAALIKIDTDTWVLGGDIE